MVSLLFRAFLFVVGSASLVPYLPIFPPYRWLWILEIAVTELSPYLLIAILLSLPFIRRSRTRVAAGIVALLVSTPLLIAVAQERNWIWDLEYGMTKSELPDPSKRSPYVGDVDSPLWTWKGFFKRTPPLTPETIPFRTKDGADLHLLRYASKASAPAEGRPWIVVVHGGGWDSGEPDQIEWPNYYFNEAGYDVFAPTYRLAPKSKWPTPADDVRAAIAFVQSHAKEYGINPKRFFLLGRSAGGQIAMKIAYASARPEGIRGVISFYAPTDLEFGYRWSLPRDILDSHLLMENYVGGSPDSSAAAYRDASPINDVSAGDPPTLLLYGKPDPLVWFRHSERLENRLRAVGVPVARIELPWATHGFDYVSTGLGGQISLNSILRFLSDSR